MLIFGVRLQTPAIFHILAQQSKLRTSIQSTDHLFTHPWKINQFTLSSLNLQSFLQILWTMSTHPSTMNNHLSKGEPLNPHLIASDTLWPTSIVAISAGSFLRNQNISLAISTFVVFILNINQLLGNQFLYFYQPFIPWCWLSSGE